MPLKSRNSNGLLEKLTPHAPVVTQNVRQDVLQGGRQMGDDGRYLTKRDGVWHYQRRAERLRRIRQARHRQAVNQDQGRQRSYRQQGDPRRRPDERNARGYWRGLAESKAIEARQAYADAVKLARSLGLDYQPPPTIAQQPPRRSARWFGARGDASAPERLPALLRSGRQFFGSGDEAIQEAQAAAEREAQHLFVPPQLQGSAKGSRSSGGADRRTDGACQSRNTATATA